MTYKEDFYRMLDGKTPASDIPFQTFNPDPPADFVPEVAMVMPDIANFMTMSEDNKNKWGVEYSFDYLATGPLPTPGKFMLTDVKKWRDVVKAPYIEGYDFKAAAEKDMAMQIKDSDFQLKSSFGLGGAFFLNLSGFMGFEGTMLAMYDEPDALHELLGYMCDYDVWVATNVLDNYDIDVVGFGDDNATEMNPFISVEMFREFLLPYYKRLYQVAVDRGLPISYHNCGRCEDFMDDMVAIGTKIWNCATPRNDLNAFRARHDYKIICEVMPRFYADYTEEETRSKVRDYIDTYAPGGAFVWSGMAEMNSPGGQQVNEWIVDEVGKYGKGYYL